MVRALHFHCEGSWVWSLVGKLRSCMPCSLAKKNPNRLLYLLEESSLFYWLFLHIWFCISIRIFFLPKFIKTWLEFAWVWICVWTYRGAISVLFWVHPCEDVLFLLCLVPQLCPTLYDPWTVAHQGSSFHGDSSGKNTGVGCHALLQGIFPAQGWNPSLLQCMQILYCLSHQGNPQIIKVIFMFISRV